MHDRISQEIGFISNSDIFRKIVQGYYNVPPDIDDYTTAYLKHLRRSPNIIEPPQSIVTTNIFQEGWPKMKERTSAGISGLQFGHLKYFSQSPLLYDFEAPLSHITYTTVYEPEYWKTFINVRM